MLNLYERAIAIYQHHAQDSHVVQNSIPILYFGDLAAYRASDLKVVTVGLNPSNREFNEDRFEMNTARTLAPEPLEFSLSSYFKRNPYNWFHCYETLLQYLETSYYGLHYPGRVPRWWQPQKNVALHTDVCTPLATDPTWKDLDSHQRGDLIRDGFPLWLDLIAELQPDLILISVAIPHREKLGDLRWSQFEPFPGCSPKTFKMMIAPFAKGAIVWGSANLVPLMNLRLEHRPLVANEILRQRHALMERESF